MHPGITEQIVCRRAAYGTRPIPNRFRGLTYLRYADVWKYGDVLPNCSPSRRSPSAIVRIPPASEHKIGCRKQDVKLFRVLRQSAEANLAAPEQVLNNLSWTLELDPDVRPQRINLSEQIATFRIRQRPARTRTHRDLPRGRRTTFVAAADTFITCTAKGLLLIALQMCVGLHDIRHVRRRSDPV